MRDVEFTPHTGSYCPVPPNTRVVYRTTNEEVKVSHIHAPVPAIWLRWGKGSDAKKAPQVGRILDYAVV